MALALSWQGGQPLCLMQPATAAAAATRHSAPGQHPLLQQHPDSGAARQDLDPSIITGVDIAARADRRATERVLARAAASPFRACSLTAVDLRLNGTAAELVLYDSRMRYGEVQRAVARSVPCARGAGAPGCCAREFAFRYGSTDWHVFQQIFGDHYLQALYALFPPARQPKFILDAGANAGYSTALFKLLFPEATVVAVEPDPSNFRALELNTQGFASVHRLQAGLWGRRANITVEVNGQLGGEWGRVYREAGAGEGGIPAYSVQDIARMFSIPAFDYVKIDIEGAEGMVFSPDADLKWVGQPRVTTLELHDFRAPVFGLKAVSDRVDAAMRQRVPDHTILADNEHLHFVQPDLLAHLRSEEGSGALGGARGKGSAAASQQHGPAAEAESSTARVRRRW